MGTSRGEIHVSVGQFTIAEWFVLAVHELVLFAAVFFAFGIIDELAVYSPISS